MRVSWLNYAYEGTLQSHILSFGKWTDCAEGCWSKSKSISELFLNHGSGISDCKCSDCNCSTCAIIPWILFKCNSQIYGWPFGFLQISPYNYSDSIMVTIHEIFIVYWKYHLRSSLTAVLFLCCMSDHRNLSRSDWQTLLTIICISLLGFIWLLYFT